MMHLKKSNQKQNPNDSFKFTFEAIGTQWVIDIFDVRPVVSEQQIFLDIKNRIEIFDKTYSRFREDSTVSEMSRTSGVYIFPNDIDPLIDIYKNLYTLTTGTFTPLIGQVLVSAGYDVSYSLQPGKLSIPPKWEDVLDYEFPRITNKKPVLLDFGAAGKGYLIDLVAEEITKHGVASFCIDAGGDIFQKNNHKVDLRVGLEHPENLDQVIGVATISNQAICGSAGNRRSWGKFHHIINPYTLSSSNNILAVWVIAKTTILADALSTCLFFTHPELIKDHYDFEYLILYPDYSIKKSPAFTAEVFYNKN